MPSSTIVSGSIILICSLVSFAAGASTPSLRTHFFNTSDAKKNSYRGAGVFTGGIAGTGTSILAVRRAYSKKAALERVTIDLGDKEAKPAGLGMGYFQAGFDAAQNRITLDVAQLRLSKVSEAQVRRVFKDSTYVRDVALTLDPEDHAATMVLNLKRPMKLEVYRTVKAGQPARIVMDLVPRKVR